MVYDADVDGGQPQTADLLAFVDRYIVSFDAWDVLAFFGAHPDGSFSPEDLSRSIGRSEEAVTDTARILQSLHALETEDRSWRLVADDAFLQDLDAFMHAIASSRGRLLVLTRVLGNVEA